MRVVLLNVLRYTLLRHRLFPRPRSLQRLLNLRLQFIRPALLPARRKPVAPPREINRGMETGIEDANLPGIGTLASGVVNAAMRNIFRPLFVHFVLILLLELRILLLFLGMAPTPPSCFWKIGDRAVIFTALCTARLTLTTFL